MRHELKKLTLEDVQFKTRMTDYWEKDLLKLAKLIEEDPKKQERVAACLCKRCMYSTTLAGQAFTSWKCGICEKEDLNSNTDTPVLCLNCAKQHKLCMDCGTDLNGKDRRKL